MRTVYRAALLSLWCLPSGCLVSFFLLGIASDEPLAYIALGLLPASVLNVLSILLSYWIDRGTDTVARWVWIANVSVLFVLVFLITDKTQGSPGLETSIIVTYVMFIAAFPISILAIGAMAGVGWAVDHALPAVIGDAAVFGRAAETGFFVLTWLVVVLAGYWQWFVLLPKVLTRFQRDGRT
jgi:hypothetical protein